MAVSNHESATGQASSGVPAATATAGRPQAARAPAIGVRIVASLALLAAPAAVLSATGGLSALGDGLARAWGPRYHLALALAVIAGAVALRAALLVLPAGRGARPRLFLAHGRLLLVVFVLAATVHLAWLQPFDLPVALVTITLAGGIFGLLALALARHAGRPAPRLVRGLDLMLTSLVLATVGLELGLRCWVAVRPHPLLVGGSADARSFLRAWRAEPGQMFYQFPINQRGDYDHEWTGRQPGQRLVVCIGDSFSTSIVPQPLHYTSRAEEVLSNTEVYNMGASSIGPPEYLLLLEEEAMQMQPDLIVLGLFVGNDLTFRVPGPRDAPRLRAWLDRDEVVLSRLVRRLRAIAAERARLGGGPVGALQEVHGEGELITTIEAALERFPFTADPSLEVPSFSESEYLRIEASRALSVCDIDGPPFAELSRYLERMQRAAYRSS